MIPVPFILAGAVGLLAMVSNRAPTVGDGRGGPRRRSVSSCTSFPWLPEQADDAIRAGLAEGIRSPVALTHFVLRAVYPTTPEGAHAPWPSQPTDCTEFRAIEARVFFRVKLAIAAHDEVLADDAWEANGGR